MNKLSIIFVLMTCLLHVSCTNDGNVAQARTDSSEPNSIKITATETPEPTNINVASTPTSKGLPEYRVAANISRPQLLHNENPKLSEHYKPLWINDEEKSDNGFEPFCVKRKINRKVVEKCGYQDAKGKVVIKPTFTKVYVFSEGMAGVCPVIDQLCGYINIKGQMVIKTNYQFVDSFSDGLGAVTIGPTDPADYYFCGYVDKLGRFAIKPQYIDCSPFKNGIAEVKINLSLKKCINKNNDDVKCVE
jgi:WG containing repeat